MFYVCYLYYDAHIKHHEIWETADQEQKDYITEFEFYIALKLIACAQNGTEANDDILSTQGM